MNASQNALNASMVAKRDVGGMLKDAREGMQLERAPIAGTLHIPVAYLEALEKGDWSVIPGEVYGRGYVRKYAGYLGFDPQKMLEQLHPLPPVQEPIRTPVLRSHKPPINFRPFLFVGALLFAGVGLAALLSTPPVPVAKEQIKPLPATLTQYLDTTPALPFYRYTCLQHADVETLWSCYGASRYTRDAPPFRPLEHGVQ